MIGDFGDRNPKEKNIQSPKYEPEKWRDFSFAREAFAVKAIEGVGGTLETRRVLILVDLNGIYLRLHEWLTEIGMPIRDGLVLSRFAFFQIQDAFERIKKTLLEESNGAYLDFDSLADSVRSNEIDGVWVNPKKTYLKFSPQFDLFFAPAPHKDIEWKLRKEARLGDVNLQRLAKMAAKGVIEIFGSERDYRAYDDFIAKLKANPEYSRSEQGFFCYNVGPKGLRYFGEKEVDTRIVMRAMDALYNYEVDDLCIVSSDQDFLPLKDKASDFGVTFYQADLAKFGMNGNTGRKIKELGSKFLPGRLNAEWPLRIIIEAASSKDHNFSAFYAIDEDELNSLCKMHNEMNEYKVSPKFESDGSVSGLILSKPAI